MFTILSLDLIGIIGRVSTLGKGLQITGSVLMNIVPMDTMNGGREDLIGQDITIRITIEILESGLYSMGSITLLGVEVQTALMLMTPDTNLGLGSSLRCPVWYTGISTGMTFPGRYEAEGQSGITSTAGVGHHIHPSLEISLLKDWLAKRPDLHGPLAAAALGVDLPVVIQSAAAVVPAVTAAIPVVAQVTPPQPDPFSLPQSQHPLPSCFHLWKKMSPVKVLGSRFRIFQYALQIQALKMVFSMNLRNLGK